ncbi:hypothetical protein FLONG3_9500 [Fusarium longipes]|uniref:Uncharacterized protein n=1 Tax=Fusarium longipes TaxID=694270 RepID=A0A395RX74_9HYPO|nr:hypothetical protein FLONG3_9500 [Fusarium longipes]
MKFTLFTQAIMAVSAATGAIAAPAEDKPELFERANCKLTIRYDKSWVKTGLDRYRMHLITTPRNDRLLDVYCGKWTNMIGFVYNKQCHWEGGHYYADGSVARGSGGHRTIRESHFAARDEFVHITGCDVDVKF